MTSSSESPFKFPPSIECLCQRHCVGIGKKVYNPDRICSNCLKRHDLQQLRIWATNSASAILVVNQASHQKQVWKENVERRGRYLCAFEDPDFQHCRWRLRDLNLRETRQNCRFVRKKGAACTRCWSRHLHKFGIVQYFTPTGLCHEEVNKIVTRSEGSAERAEGGEDDVEGYNEAPPKPHCAFGTACDATPGGQEKGANMCTWCKNMSFDALYEHSESHPDKRWLNRLVDGYMHELERENEERINKGWAYLCACKDPEYRFQVWRHGFNPRDSRLCGTVRHRGQLCSRCYQKAGEQGCEWLANFEADRLGFPCVFDNPQLRRSVDLNWRLGPMDERGRPDPGWEKDSRKDGRCDRARHKNQLCQKCFNRMCEIRGFGRYFDTEWGILREGYGL